MASRRSIFPSRSIPNCSVRNRSSTTKGCIATSAMSRTMSPSSRPTVATRCAEVAAIRRHKVAIWGSNWPRKWSTLSGQHRVHPPVWGSAVGNIMAKAAVSLNVLNAENLGGPNMRTFEIPGSGGVMLARYSPEQHEFFPEGEAALYYRSPEEIDAKIDELLRDRDLRERIRRNAIRWPRRKPTTCAPRPSCASADSPLPASPRPGARQLERRTAHCLRQRPQPTGGASSGWWRSISRCASRASSIPTFIAWR